MQPELWKPVVGHEGSYEVSSLGRVRSLDRTCIYERIDQYSGRVISVRRHHKGKELRPGRMPSGHMSVAIGKGNSICVHILVLEAFVGPCPNEQEARHLNDVPCHNTLENLCWGTRSENLHDAVRTGHKPVGERQFNAKLANADVPVIRSLFGVISFAELGRRYGVSETTIRQIKNGKTWKHIQEVSAC